MSAGAGQLLSGWRPKAPLATPTGTTHPQAKPGGATGPLNCILCGCLPSAALWGLHPSLLHHVPSLPPLLHFVPTQLSASPAMPYFIAPTPWGRCRQWKPVEGEGSLETPVALASCADGRSGLQAGNACSPWATVGQKCLLCLLSLLSAGQ